MKIVITIVFLFIFEVFSQNDISGVDNKINLNEIEGPQFLEEIPVGFNVPHQSVEDLPLVDNFLEWSPEQENEELKLRIPEADPTLHKWKHKRPSIHSFGHTHIHTVTHGHSHDFETPVFHSAQHQPLYQSHIANIPQKQYTIVKEYGIENNFQAANQNFNQWNQQNTHSPYNQNLHQGITNGHSNHESNIINHHQNAQLSNQNHFHSSGNLHHSDSSKPGIVNINGHTNTFIQSGTSHNVISSHNGQVFQQGKASSSPNLRDELLGISMPVEEETYWQDNFHGSEPQVNPSELINPAVYDSKMNNILNILDERSFYRERPEVEPGSYGKNAEDPDDRTGEEPKGFYVENQRELDSVHEDYNLKSPNLIRVPYNNYFHNYGYNRNGREKRSHGGVNVNVLSNNSMLFNISSWRLKDLNSKLDDTLLEYRNVVDDYREKLTDKRETLFTDVLESIINQFQMREYKNPNEIKKIGKRSATITKLLNNPDVRLDVPKTLDNIGTITRNAFEDERSPMYHVRKFIGSTKNAVLSAMKIPPQNLVIPSNYEIKNINPEEIEEEEDNLVSGINPKILSRSGFRNTDSAENFPQSYPNDPYGIVETFARVGGAIRDSVRSGQNTLIHISEVAHNARKIFQTTKNTVPRVLLPYAKAPVLLTSRFKDNKRNPLKKAIIISPKVLDVTDSLTGSQRTEPEYVSMGNILDAIGLTKPNNDRIDLEKIVVKMPGQGETRGLYIPPIGDVKSVNGRKIPNFRDNLQMQQKNKENLGRMQDKVASTKRIVKENIKKIKNDISKTLDDAKNEIKPDTLQMKQSNNMEKALNISPQIGISNNKASKNKVKHFTKKEEEEIIDKFLYNILQIDSKAKSDPIISQNSIKKNENRTTMITKRKEMDKGEPILGLPNISETDLEETIKNIAMDILKDEYEIENFTKKNIKSNKIPKDKVKKNKANLKKTPKFILKSRFGDDEDSETQNEESNNSTDLQLQDLDKNEDEAMRKVDKYVLNDVGSPMSDSTNDENVKSSWKMGNVLELIEDPSAEESSREMRSQEVEEMEKVPVFSSRNLLWLPNDVQETGPELSNIEKEESEHVGLNLPPELMTPFMARSSNADIDQIFGNGKQNRQNIEDAATSKNEEDNTDQEELLGLNLPPELMKPFMARDANTNIDETFTSDEKYDRPNIFNDNDEMQNYLPLLMMPLRTTKSVKKTLDEFLKKENETEQQIQNIQENRLKESKDFSDEKNEGLSKEQLYTMPPSEFMQKMGFPSLSVQNCGMKKCYKTGSSDEDDQQSFSICVCISEDNKDEYSEHPRHLNREVDEFEAGDARKGVGQARTSMDVSESLRKPFMGLGNDESIKKFYDEYNMQQHDGALFGSEEEHELFSDD